jgi:hypothetical protein
MSTVEGEERRAGDVLGRAAIDEFGGGAELLSDGVTAAGFE